MSEKIETPAMTFGKELRCAREARGWSQYVLSEELLFKQSYISKVETGRQLASAAFAEQCDKVFGTAGMFVRLRQWAVDSGNAVWFIPYLHMEREALAIREYAPTLVPGMLQTPGYVQAVYRSGRPEITGDGIQQRVVNRQRRREMLDGPNPPSFWVILHESALWTSMGGPSVMRKQLHHLVVAAEHPRITLQVFPFAGSPARANSFTVLTRQDRTEILYQEIFGRGRMEDSVEAVTAASAAFDRLRANALSFDDSISRIRHVMEVYTHERDLRPQPYSVGQEQPQPGRRRQLRRVGPHVRIIRPRRPHT
ncbi:transcriptional regulator [Streptomyces griseocarneus]|nr:transcriptional regulator [Streptomyces griseocarneus]